jgi:dihydrolipoamide dehydrogenase
MNSKFDVAVIGGGPGGTPAAMRLAAQGKSVLLVEESGKLGGACLFVGCIPSKIIRHWSEEFAAERNFLGKKVWSSEDRATAWKQITTTMNSVLERRSSAAMKTVNNLATLEFVAGHARFVSGNELLVEETTRGRKETYTFDNAVIATGVRSLVPPFKGNAVQDVLTSEVFFTQNRLPETLLIVGGGPIGIELAQMLSKLGVKCTIVELLESILSGVVEPEFAEIIAKELSRSNTDIYTSSKVQELNRSDGHITAIFTDAKGIQHREQYEHVLVATGKVPNVESLDLGKAGIEFNRKGVVVNDFLETTAKGIYATGDVIDGPKFAHTATYEAQIAAANILAGNKKKVDFVKNSWVLFSEPEIASVGYTEAKAVLEGYDVVTGVYNYMIDAAAQVANAPFGYLKYVVNKENMEIIGIGVCNNNAASLAGEAALIVAHTLSLTDVAKAIHPHPTMTEAFGILAQTMLSKS